MRSSLLASVLPIAFVLGCGEPAHRPTQSSVPADAEHDGTTPVVTLSRVAQDHLGIRVAPLEARTHQAEQLAYGTVLSLQSLAQLGQSYARAEAQARSAGVQRRVTREQYLRLKHLNEADQNASTRARQAAGGAFDMAAADARGARESLHAVRGAALQKWGSVVAGWLFTGSPAYRRLVDGREVLLRITLPVGARLEPVPRSLRVRSPRAELVSVTLVSPAPETDPRIQGMSYFYQASARQTQLLPGMAVVAHLPVGQPQHGVVILNQAVVWWRGKPHAYVQVAPEKFTRRTVPTETPFAAGYFAVSGFPPGTLVVITGAQELLSLEVTPPAVKEEDTD